MEISGVVIPRVEEGQLCDPALPGLAGAGWLAALDAREAWAVGLDRAPGLAARVADMTRRHLSFLDRAAKPFAQVLAQCTSSRSLLLMGFVAHRNPRFVTALQSVLSDPEAGGAVLVMRRRMVAMRRAQRLAQVFAPERLARIVAVLQATEGTAQEGLDD